MKQADVFYRAMQTRDNRFDGKFFIGVKTTGIYCRPICPAKPKRVNIQFFKNHLEAERAGFRPCLRCRPESAPLSPAWIGKSAIVRRAIKMIQAPQTQGFNENDFAAVFGVSSRHLRRLFMEEIGKTPKQLVFENRLNLSRKLITETKLPISEIAFASGFNSIRRFNDSFKDRYKVRPRNMRREKSGKHSKLCLSLPYRPPLDFAGLLQSYKNHRIGNLERFEGDKMVRVIEFGGKTGEIFISNDSKKSKLILEIDFPDTSRLQEIILRVRSLFDLDSDPLVIANTLETCSKFESLLKKHPGVRLPSGWDPFEISISTILGQLVSVDHGRRLVNDLIELLGTSIGAVKLFPTPSVIANCNLEKLKTTRARRQTVIAFSKAVANREITLAPTQDVEEFVKKVSMIKGIGPWTANYMALKVLRHADSFPGTDLILSKALKTHSLKSVNAMSPWRGYVAMLLWKEYADKKGDLK